MITWTLTEQQADYILSAVAQRPYAETAALIAELMRQAQPKTLPPIIPHEVTPKEMP